MRNKCSNIALTPLGKVTHLLKEQRTGCNARLSKTQGFLLWGHQTLDWEWRQAGSASGLT